tara:strand:- start:11990 stop:12628 length:639 start_codon:yes stop_codon:yes gene_type:complete
MLPPLLQTLEEIGFKVYDGGHAFNLNIVGIRSSTRDQSEDQFDDLITCTYREEKGGRWITKSWAATTDPGAMALRFPEMYNADGTAIIARGQYQSAYVLGLHSNRYEALVARGPKPITIYRDADRDLILEFQEETKETGYFGTNIHKAGKDSRKISGINSRTGKKYTYSAGCQVFKKERDFLELMDLCHLQIEHHPTWKTFSYSLIDEEDIA